MKIRNRTHRMTLIFAALLLSWVVAVQSGCFSMRISDRDWSEKLKSKGQFNDPVFSNLQCPNGRRIHTVGIKSADFLPTVILVHGSPGASDAYLDYLADTSLTNSAQLVSLDRPGFGHTSGFGRPEPSLLAQANAVLAVANSVSPGKKVLLVGHSLGAPIIARFAMEYPEQTAGLIFVAGSIDPAQEEHPWWQSVINAPPIKWLTPKALWASNAEIIPLEKELEEILPLWTRVTCPVRILHAQDDQLVPVANVGFAQRMLSNCPDLKVEILPNGDHFILWSRQEKIKAAIKALLTPQ